jgi:hypothetical protein
MESQDLILGIILVGFLFWYFNIRGLTKCITYNLKCDGVKCIKQKFD